MVEITIPLDHYNSLLEAVRETLHWLNTPSWNEEIPSHIIDDLLKALPREK